jgi:hypothetical protein
MKVDASIYCRCYMMLVVGLCYKFKFHRIFSQYLLQYSGDFVLHCVGDVFHLVIWQALNNPCILGIDPFNYGV